MSVRAQLLLWAQRVVRNKDGPPHTLLELRPDASAEQVQEAFHKIARTAHPDLHRTGLTPDELELVTTAYARVAGAYQTMRMQQMPTQKIALPTQKLPLPTQKMSHVVEPVADAPPVPAATPPQAMSPKAVVYYRKAELCLKRGDLRGAVLQLKLACAADPASGFLRTALAEVEAEARKT